MVAAALHSKNVDVGDRCVEAHLTASTFIDIVLAMIRFLMVPKSSRTWTALADGQLIEYSGAGHREY